MTVPPLLALVLGLVLGWSILAIVYRVGRHVREDVARLRGVDDRGRVQFTDVFLAFGVLVTFVAVAPWVYTAIGMATSVVDPLSSTLLSLSVPLFVIGMIISIGVSARSS